MSDPTPTTAYIPVEPFLAAQKRRPTAKRDGIGAWLRDEIAYLESIDRTDHGTGALAAYKATLEELECADLLRLEAAAPDLLAALKGVLRVADRQTAEFDAARAAIAKAEGGQ